MRRFAAGFELAECPRWHAGALWLSDMWGRTVYRMEPGGPVVHADLAPLVAWPCNDMIVADDVDAIEVAVPGAGRP